MRATVKREIVVSIRMTLATLVVTGLAYPLVLTGLAQVIFPARANGSLVKAAGRVVGSELIGQRFAHPAYVHPRPSAAGADGYDPTASAGSNLGPTSATLRDRVAAETQRLRAGNPHAPGPIPIDLVTASASGLDPHLSPEAALWQAPRIAEARGIPVEQVEDAVRRHVEARTFGLLGEPRVNVLRLNLDLDARFGAPAATPRVGAEPGGPTGGRPVAAPPPGGLVAGAGPQYAAGAVSR